MISSILMLCGEGVVRDADTNNVSVFNIFDQVSSQNFPFLIHKVSVFNVLSKDSEDEDEADFFIKFFSNKNELMKLPVRIKFGRENKTRSIFQINGLVVPEPGEFEIQLLDNQDVIISKYCIDAVLVENTTIEEIGSTG